MNRRLFVSSATAFALGTRGASAAGLPGSSPSFETSLRDKLQTRAELSQFAETSSNADVEHFIATLDDRGAPIVRGVLGTSAKGREIPYFVSSRPVLTDGDAARAAKKPVVFVVTGAHANEPDGKEAVLAVLRDLALSTEHTILEDMVLVIVPNLNVDGNANMLLASINGPTLDSPTHVGTALDGAGVDLERDFLGLRSNAVAQLVDLLKFWNPDVYIDLRTAATSYTAFALTYAPSLHPAAFYGGTYARDTMLPALQKNMKDKFGMETFVAGGFGKNAPMGSPRPGVDLGWYAPDDDARIASNYVAIRGTATVTAYASPHDIFERRVFYLRAFLETALQYCSDSSDELISRTRLASHWTTGAIPIRTTRDPRATSKGLVSWQQPVIEDHSHDHQAGMPLGLRLDGKFFTSLTPVYDRYAGTLYAQQPFGYAIDASHAPMARQLLARHGVQFDVISRASQYRGQTFTPTRIDRSVRPDGTQATLANGTWTAATFAMPAGSLFVIGQQPLGPLLSLLLEPECDCGLVALGAFSSTLAIGSPHKVLRVEARV